MPARGFQALKTNLLSFAPDGSADVHMPGFARGPSHPALHVDARLAERAQALVQHLREGAPHTGVMLDLNFNVKPEGARRLADALAGELEWLEIDGLDADSLAWVRAHSRVPIASLEAAYGRAAILPYLQARAVDEVAAIGERELTGDDVAALPYVAAIVHEALRLCPPSPALGRTATSDVAVDGYRVPAGSLLIYGTAAVQRDPALWDRPDEFDPDRFMGAAAKTHDRWQYAPFGAGPRTCIGDHFAMLEATLALATVLRRIEITSVDDDFPVEFPFTLVAAEPIRAMVHRR